MGGGRRNTFQDTAASTAGGAVSNDQYQANALRGNLADRSAAVNTGLPATMQQTQNTASNLALTGGYTPVAPDLSGRGRDTYQTYATTGGLDPSQRQQFLQRAVAPVNAVYGQAQDNLQRSRALQGGYSPGFTASQARITRGAANAGSTGMVNAQAGLADTIRQGQLAGAGGLASTRAAAGGEAQAQAQAVQQGKIAGQDALQRYSQFGVSALNQNDIIGIQNRAQTGQLSIHDSTLLSQLAAQNPTVFQQIMSSIGAIGGAAAGIATGVGGLGGKSTPSSTTPN